MCLCVCYIVLYMFTQGSYKVPQVGELDESSGAGREAGARAARQMESNGRGGCAGAPLPHLHARGRQEIRSGAVTTGRGRGTTIVPFCIIEQEYLDI